MFLNGLLCVKRLYAGVVYRKCTISEFGGKSPSGLFTPNGLSRPVGVLPHRWGKTPTFKKYFKP